MRTIVVGDVHGCRRELERLIGKLDPRGDDDVLAVGDFLTKGPDGSGAVAFWRDRGFASVLGNNDVRVLDAIRGGADGEETVEEAARDLERFPDLVDWISSWPVVIHRPDRALIVVHGGLFPGPFDESEVDERRHDLMRLRNIREVDGRWMRISRRDVLESDPFWAEEWAGPETVVYGHTPEPEVNRWPHAIGIDTGCVYGYELSAAIRDERGRWEFASEPAQRVWYEG